MRRKLTLTLALLAQVAVGWCLGLGVHHVAFDVATPPTHPMLIGVAYLAGALLLIAAQVALTLRHRRKQKAIEAGESGGSAKATGMDALLEGG